MRDHLVDRLPRVPAARLDAMLRRGSDRRPRRAGRAGDAVPAARVPVVPPRPARRGAGAVRGRRPAPRRRRAGGGQTALPGHHPARPPCRRDRARAAAPRARPARPVAGPPARPRDGRACCSSSCAASGAGPTRRCSATGGSARPTRPSPRTTRRCAAADGAQPDRQGARGRSSPARCRDRPTPRRRVELLEHRGGLARYRLTPLTGRTHQLRLHLRGLGVPILGDRFYATASGDAPEDTALDDWTRPLQLLATVLELPDPATGVVRRFTSRRTLQAWTDPAGWAAGALDQQVSVSSKE